MQTKEKRQEYYQKLKEVLKEKSRNRYRKLSIEQKEKNKKRAYGYYIKNRDIIIIRRKKYASYGKHKEGYKNTSNYKYNYLKYREKSMKFKTLVLKHYGEKCECCGENNFSLLTVDHIENNGREHKNKNGRKLKGVELYIFLVKENYPTGLRIYCFNCNIGRQFNRGICPHINPIYPNQTNINM